MAQRRIAIIISVQGANKAASQVGGLNNQIQRATHLQGGLTASFLKGNLAARGISMAIASVTTALKFGVSQAVDFEFSMKKVSAITGIAGQDFKSLETTVRELSSVSPRTAAEVANTALAMSKLGLSGREVEDALAGVINLSVALDEDVTAVGSALVNVKNVFKLSASELTKISDSLFKSFSSSALNLDKFSTAFSFAGGAAKLAGVEFEQLTAAMGLLSNSGIRSSTIGTQLRSIFIQLSDASSKAGKLIGGETIKTIGLVEALRRVRDAQLEAGDVKKIFGLRAVSVVAALTKEVEKLDEFTASIKDSTGATQKASDTLTDSMAVAAKEVSSAFTDLNIELSKIYSPIVTTGLRDVASILRGIVNGTNFAGMAAAFSGNIPAAINKTTDELDEMHDAATRALSSNLPERPELDTKSKDKNSGKSGSDGIKERTKALQEWNKAERERIANEAMFIDFFAGEDARLEKEESQRQKELEKSLTAMAKKDEAIAKQTLKVKELKDGYKELQESIDSDVFQRQITSFLQITSGVNGLIASFALLGRVQTDNEVNLAEAAGKSEEEIATIRKKGFEREKRYALVMATINTAQAITKALTGAVPPISFVLAGLAGAAGAIQIGAINSQKFATGFDGVVRQPTLMQVGEAGPERVQVTSSAKTARKKNEGDTYITVQGSLIDVDGLDRAVNRANQNISRRFVNV